uniref:Uncharacterized protein n=1 Tax=Leersia perrieri TaxID=77586 RepID=A0A0D9XMC1_9ORYZ
MSAGAQPEGSHQSAPSVKPALSSCRRNKSENTSFVSDLRDNIQEFIHASPDEHRTCFTKTIQRMFGLSKVVAERSAQAKEPEAESVLPLQTTVSRVRSCGAWDTDAISFIHITRAAIRWRPARTSSLVDTDDS